MGLFIIYEANFFILGDSFVLKSIAPDKHKHSSFILTSASVMCFPSLNPFISTHLVTVLLQSLMIYGNPSPFSCHLFVEEMESIVCLYNVCILDGCF